MYYLGITTTKKIAPFPGAEKERGEFAVQRQLEALGITSHVPVRIDFLRRGKRRYAEPVTEVLLPNYIFADIPAEKYFHAVECRGLVPSMMAISQQSMRAVQAFIDKSAAKEREARRIIEANDRAAMCQFEPGDLLEILDGPFMGEVRAFSRMINDDNDPHPYVGVDVPMFGKTATLKFDPLAVRKAG